MMMNVFQLKFKKALTKRSSVLNTTYSGKVAPLLFTYFTHYQALDTIFIVVYYKTSQNTKHPTFKCLIT